MFLTILMGTLALVIIWDYLNKKRRNELFAQSHIDGPRSLPILGCGLEALSLGSENLVQYIGECFSKYGKTFRMWILNEAQIYTMDVRHFERILSSTTLLQKGDLYEFIRPWINDGLLVSFGHKWHSRRKVFTTAFHFKVLEHYVTVFDEQSDVMVKQLAPCADGKTAIDMIGKVCLAALDIITEAAMGVRVNAQLDPNFPYVKALKSVVYVQPNRMLNFSQRYDWLYRLTAPKEFRNLQNDINIMHEFTIKVIEERRATLERSIADGSYKPISMADNDIGLKSQMALLDILLQAKIDGKPLTNEDICEEVDTFMFEGDDTTTSSVSHALYSIARHPAVQAKLIQEIHTVIGTDKDAPITIQQLQELKYMDCVVKETLRLYPSVPALGRKTTKDFVIDDQTIPANTSVYMVPYYAHRNPTYFPDPEAFNPERFAETSEDSNDRNAFVYIPFSAGPKNCIGQKFAMLEMKALISKILRYYELLPLGPDIVPMMNFILRSSTGIHVGLRPRVNQ